MSELPEPYWQDESRGLRIFLGDCRVFLPLFADGEFGSVITDPPFGVQYAEWDTAPDADALSQFLRVSSGTVVMFGPKRATDQRHFWLLEPPIDRVVCWYPYRLPNRTQEWYPIFVWRDLGRNGLYNNVLQWSFFEPGRPRHIPFAADHDCLKPIQLLAQLVKYLGGTSVLDPYLGSGTTLAACAKLGIPGTGIEISEAYCEMAAARLSEDLGFGEPNLFNRAEVTA